MGTQLSSILRAREIQTKELENKTLAVDSFNILYQFLSSIRQYDGTLLKDSKGEVTSHLSGLYYRFTKLMQQRMRFVFVFDGRPPELKNQERERRKERKDEAEDKFRKAEQEGDVELMRKYAARTSHLTQEMVEEAKELITALGQPIVQAPSEGEATAAALAKKGHIYGLLSQDTDGLLFGSPRLIKNLSITARKKKGPGTTAVAPEVIDLAENLNLLGIDREQLIVIGMLTGTDFNVGGIKGIGPKKALELVRKHKKDFESLFKEAEWEKNFTHTWKEVFDIIYNMPVAEEAKLVWGKVDKKRVIDLLVKRHEFSQERVEKSIEELVAGQKQSGLSEFF